MKLHKFENIYNKDGYVSLTIGTFYYKTPGTGNYAYDGATGTFVPATNGDYSSMFFPYTIPLPNADIEAYFKTTYIGDSIDKKLWMIKVYLKFRPTLEQLKLLTYDIASYLAKQGEIDIKGYSDDAEVNLIPGAEGRVNGTRNFRIENIQTGTRVNEAISLEVRSKNDVDIFEFKIIIGDNQAREDNNAS